ncbi:hypothetical protein NADFUDRAFT_83108 [Nadsonia fulvescens var. elongata DSM 6958]|uniref:Transcription factor Iwr1 domain-containing protein n=1 Tax=Nadsonia fulvescens var. elongata DSM 6958 TaxID=857566 RepID=A0A1E3PIF3_9ASCO|nr:hypothetical protein NADFUDRAFT_83108 [Nadsonia fulvescens var. elongata DSM 6958]
MSHSQSPATTRVNSATQKPASIPPSTVRIKRKRNQDPLAALVLDDQTKKRSRTDSFVFKFAGTVDDQSFKDGDLLKEAHAQLNLTQADDAETENHINNGQRIFRFSKTKKQKRSIEETTEELPDSLSEMIKSYLKIENEDFSNHGSEAEATKTVDVNQESSQTKRPFSSRRKSQADSSKPQTTTLMDNNKTVDIKDIVDSDSDEYVYDIYYREVVTSGYQYEGPNIGFILFDDDDQEAFKNNEEYDSERELLTDDEDSNAEDFYKNDYPDEESDASDNSASEFAFSSLDREKQDINVSSDDAYSEESFDDDDDDDGYGYDGRTPGFGGSDEPSHFNSTRRGSNYMDDEEELDLELDDAMNDDENFDNKGDMIGENDDDNKAYRRASSTRAYHKYDQQVNEDAIEGDWSEDEWDQYRNRLFGKLTELVENDK